jgi:hypothetical protein
MLTWLPPFRVEVEAWGKGFGDLALANGCDALVSDRFHSLYREHGLTGLSGFEPVEVVKVKRHRPFGQELPSYRRVAVRQARAAVDVRASGMELDAPPCGECRIAEEMKGAGRLVIEPETWRGEDLFVPRGLPSTVLTSERFKEFCDAFRITNAVLVPADQYSFDFGSP